MVRSLSTAATGMQAMQFYLDNISNNLSNLHTNGFKRTRVEFQDLMYQALREPGVRNFEGSMAPAGIEVGLGVKTAGTHKVFEQGSPTLTENPFDLAIAGEGFLQVMMPDGSIAYTRDGSLKKSSDGTIVTAAGFVLHPQIVIPEGSDEFTVTQDGRVSVRLYGEELSTDIGQLELVRFINPAGLRNLGGNLYGYSDASGSPIVSLPGEEGAGTILQRYVEASNVQLVEEMVNMIQAQRAYEIVSKAITVSEEMLQVANNLKR